MLSISPSYADDILTICISGRLGHQDIESLLIPAIEAKLQEHTSIGLWFEFSPEFVGISVNVLWDDAWLSLFDFKNFSRVVMIVGATHMDTMIDALSLMLPCPVKVFSTTERNQAVLWLEQVAKGEQGCDNFTGTKT